MNMQDNDMDQLFRNKLENLEVKPSDRVWKGIVVELDGAKTKRSLVPVLRIAATITVITAIGLFFLIKGSGPAKNQVANNRNAKNPVLKAGDEDPQAGANVEELMQQKKQDQQVAAVRQNTTRPINKAEAGIKKGERNSKRATVDNIAKAGYHRHQSKAGMPVGGPQVAEPLQPSETQTLAALTSNNIKVSQPVVPDESLTAVKPIVPVVDDFKTTNKVAVAQLPASKPVKSPAKKHGIRSFGDLINVVIAKVDKRQDKVIEFSNTDDDEATITGINLGIVKVKRDK